MSAELAQKSKEQLNQRTDILKYAGMVALLGERIINSEYLRQQVITELAESLDAPLETPHDSPIKLQVENGKLMSDGEDLGDSFWQWANINKRTAELDNSYEWFADFALAEAQEHDSVVNFYDNSREGDVYLVISAMPENAPSDLLLKRQGFRSDIKRSFIRTYTKTENGLEERVASIDSSNVRTWGKVLGIEVFSAQMLLREGLCIKDKPANEIIDEISAKYDNILYEQTGIVHSRGRPQGGNIEAITFVNEQGLLINSTIDLLKYLPKNTDDIGQDDYINEVFYNAKSTLHRLFNERNDGGVGLIDSGANIVNIMTSDGITAVSNGVTYSGCSGENSINAPASNSDTSSSSHSDTFSMPKAPTNMEMVIMIDTECPFCCQKVKAPYDTERGLWLSCGNARCDAYVPEYFNKSHKTYTNHKTPERKETKNSQNNSNDTNSNDNEEQKKYYAELAKDTQYKIWSLKARLFETYDETEKQIIKDELLRLGTLLQQTLYAL